MVFLTRALSSLPRALRGGVTIEQGLIAALVGVVIVSIVTTLGGTLDSAAQGASPAQEDAASR